MVDTHYKVEVQRDHLEKLASARPIQALAELVWNALDADATDVRIEIDSTDFGMQSVAVRDNGHGIPHRDVPKLFGQLGGSWKTHGSRSKTMSRMLHGKEGKGRFKALALGRVTDWSVVADTDSSRAGYTITLIKDNLIDVRVTEPVIVAGTHTGVEVRVSELYRDFKSLEGENAVQELSEVFALYLSDYPDVSISLNSERLDPSKAIATRESFSLKPLEDGQNKYPFDLELIEWKTSTERVVYLCTENGFPLQRRQPRFHTPGFQFSAYLKSTYISKLHESGALELAEMNPALQEIYETAQDQIKDYFKGREAEAARSEIEQWKTEHVYPYIDEPKTSVEEAERKVFDIVALNVNRHLPEFSESSRKTKAFQLRMLRQAIERGSEELQKILIEVLELPERKQRELAKLLEEASLANVISASKLVADRLKFLGGIEALLFDPVYKNHLKERSQLHRILADNNTWLFGEEFSLTVDDQSLTEVLRKHRKAIGDDTVIDTPVTRIDGKKGIVDLMLSRSVPQNRQDEREHLIVELKRPTVKLGMAEITQVKSYAYAVAEDERFEALNTRWNFWVVSNAFAPDGKREARQSDRSPGQVFKDGNIEVWCKTWAELLEGAKSRMKFVDDRLQANVNKEASLEYLQKTYEKYLSGISDDSEDSPNQDDVDAA
ncbi:MAG: DNA mismatch repair protein [Rhodospirillales bacterium]|nr:DNA mismatch repair protein [Rhodospirillales bacterium]